jgi:adenylate cyclase
VIIFVIIFANRITKPLVALANQTQKIKDFELDDFNHIKSVIYEIKLMSDAAFSMVQGLQSFRRYVPAALVRELINAGKEAKLGASDETELTILFTDIQGFTSISENMKAQDLMLHLSDYFEHLSSIIMEEHGTIDKYIGDAIMAFWGAPQKLPNAPYLTCKAALRCQQQLKVLNNQWIKEGKPPMFTRMGIHSGRTLVGNLGSQYRMNYTVIGDSANLASRLEGVNKLYGTQIIISETTYKQISDQFFCRALDVVAVKGKKIGVKIYELIADKNEPISEEKLQFCRDFEQGFETYLKRDWESALVIFETLEKQYPEDLSVKLFIERCRTFQVHPVPADWNGSIVLHEK